MTARGGKNIRRRLFAASLLVVAGACSDDRAGAPAAGALPAVQAPGTAGLPNLAEQPAAPADPPPSAAQLARSAATDLAREPNEVDWSGGDPAHGQVLYATHCAICHGGGGAGDGIATPALNPKPRDFRDARFYIDADANNQTGEDVDLARVILHGPAAFGGTNEMVGSRDAFSDQDVRDLIAHIRTLAAPKPATPAGTPAS